LISLLHLIENNNNEIFSEGINKEDNLGLCYFIYVKKKKKKKEAIIKRSVEHERNLNKENKYGRNF